MPHHLSEIIDLHKYDFENRLRWDKLKSEDLLSKGALSIFPWDPVMNIIFYGTVGRYDYTAEIHGYHDVFAVRAYFDKNILVVGADHNLISSILSCCGKNLQSLEIMFSDCGSIDVSKLTGLNTLNFMYNNGLSLCGLSDNHSLKNAVIHNADIGNDLDLRGSDNLKRLILYNVPVAKVIVDKDIQTVIDIQLFNTQISDFSFLKRFSSLRVLRLFGENVNNLDNVEFPLSVEILGIQNAKITSLPRSLRRLKNLQRLCLEHLTLHTLPDWLPELGLSYHGQSRSIHLTDTTVLDMDNVATFFEQTDDVINEWLVHRTEMQGSAPLNEAKIIFLGDGGAGKSHIVQRLLHDGVLPDSFNGEVTPGIAIDDRYYERNGRKIQVHFWDFGGQEILHSMHRMFLTRNTLYVVVVNARDNTQDERARYWLHNIKSFAEGSPVLLVLNQIDQNENASLNEKSLRILYPKLTSVVKLSAKYFNGSQFAAAMTEPLLQELYRMEILNEPFLPAWTKLKTSLHVMTECYIDEQTFLKKCDACGVGNSLALRNDLLSWFNVLGISFCYRDTPELSDYMVLRPDWITNAIYMILFNSHHRTNNGLIKKNDIYAILHPEGDNTEKIKAVNREMRYKKGDVNYILGVTREFHLSYNIDKDTEFFPMLCDRNEKSIAEEYACDEFTLELQMRYPYLPNNVIHRLMVELRRQLDIENVWFSGALFKQSEMGLSAVVKSEDNKLIIYVKGEDPLYSANTYLGDLKSAVDAINAKLGLTPTSFIIFKKDGLSDEFMYDTVIKSKQLGNKDIYSPIYNANISLDAILNKSVNPEDEKWRGLRDYILGACKLLQNEKLYAQASENDRNTFVRDFVRVHYDFSDQSLHGWSATGISSGSPDGVIHDERGNAFSVYEGLNIKSCSSLSKKTWNQHLDKLINSYNPNGCKRLFLVGYVENKDFLGLWNSYCDHLSSYAPAGYRLKLRIIGQTDVLNIQYAECYYEKSGVEIVVYCVFVSFRSENN